MIGWAAVKANVSSPASPNARWRSGERRGSRPFSLLSAVVVAAILPLSAASAERSACATLAAQVDAAAPSGPVFLASYPGTTIRELKDAAFLYDNAVAAIALVGCNDLVHARRIADAILFAQDHDRFWRDGRLRNAYLAGAPTTPVKLAGWWDERQNRWVEDGYQVASDNGNLAWAMLALLAVDRASPDARYRAGAARLGGWLVQWRRHKGPGGFAGGTFGEEPDPLQNTWKSTEHNTDIAAAFAALARATGDRRWLAHANAAEQFVRAMWTSSCGCYAVGTGLDGTTPNTMLALDAQIFPALARDAGPPPAAVLDFVGARLGQAGGYAYYDNAFKGVWTEGTAQVALLAAVSGRAGKAAALARVLATQRTPDGGYYASSTVALPTGFMTPTASTTLRRYFHIPALAPLAWVALVERRFNPFTGERATPR